MTWRKEHNMATTSYKYLSTDGKKRLAKYGRLKKIYFTSKGGYIIYLNSRLYLDDIMRLTYPIFYTNDDGKTGTIGGYFATSAFGGYLVEITDDGEYIQLWNEWDLT